MSKLCWRVTPVNGYDIPALERWLEEMAGKGLLFSMTMGLLTAFEQGEGTRLRIHLEPARGSVSEEPPELADLYAQAGWRYLGPFRGSYFVYATGDREARAYTDPESMDWALGRFFRQKLLGGLGLLAANALLLALYYNMVGVAFTYLHDGYPVTAFAHYPLAALLLTVLGLALVDLSWFLGLGRLRRFRRSIAAGQTPELGRRGGWLLAAGVVVLIPVVINTCQLFLGMDYRAYPASEAQLLTIEEIEGDGLRATGDRMYNMDYVSHGGTLLEMEYWYWRQYSSFPHYEVEGNYWDQVPVVQYSIRRFPLTALAQAYWEEQGRIGWYGYDPVEGLVRDAAFDAVSAKRGENGRGVPQTTLVLRRGRTVMRVEYRGEKDLLEFQEELAAMMAALE